ncbi:MAG: hypothetical protein DMG05_06755 [Acidobacteria bacterium]|nr:MAG: hypothetical protein DMG05_06755 [Acidobacteriota bacterium]
MLQKIIENTGLNPSNCANLLGISPAIFSEWSAGQRQIPESVVSLLSTVLGVQPSTLSTMGKHIKSLDVADITPAIWYKLRAENLGEADCEYVPRESSYSLRARMQA